MSVTGLGSTTLSITGLGSTTLATLTAILTSKRVYPSALAPVLILGNLTTIHGNPTPLPLPILSVPGDNATLSSGATVSIIIATGTGASSGNYTAVVPYISRGTRARSRPGRLWLSLWGTCLLGMVGVVSYL